MLIASQPGRHEKEPIRETPGSHPYGGQVTGAPEYTAARGRFSYWFHNVFWYHYKWHLLIGIVLAALAAFFIRDLIRNTTPDFQYVVASNSYISNESLIEMNDIAAYMFRNPDTDKRAECIGYGIWLSAEGEWGMAAFTRLATFFVDDSVRLFIFDADLLEAYFNEPDSFADLGAQGFRTVQGKPWLVDLTGLPLMERIGLKGVSCFAAIQLGRNDAGGLPDPRSSEFLRVILNTR